MGETIPSQTIPKKLVSRNVAIALGIICIILVVGVVGAFAYYMPMINDKNNTISSLNTQISQSTTNNTNLQSWLVGNETLLSQTQTWLVGNITAYNNYVSDHHHTDEEYNSLNSQIADKNSQITNLQSIVDLQKQEVVVDQLTVNQGAGQSSVVAGRPYSYSGYLDVSSTSTTSKAYITLQYWFGGKLYSFSQTVGTSGDVIFAILKTDSATVYVGNTNYINGATETVTITYYY